MKQINICPVCGGKLEKKETEFVCLYCNGVFQEDTVQDIEEKMNNMLDKFKQELVANTRTQLWDAIHEKYLSSERILNLSRNIKTYLPDDFLANFFEFVNTKSHTQEQINEYINNIDYKEYYYLVDVVLDFMIRSLEPGNLLCLNNLIENTYKQNYLKLYNEYTSRLAKEAEKVKSGVYDLTMERDVFVAYSSKDIKHVEEVVKLLNQEGISYFVALENLRHGKGAVENYDKALEQAIENCKTFLFISSTNSRTRECDALKKEIPYLKKLDKLNAPAEFRNDYSKMPLKYKKPRVQLLIGDTPTGTLGDKQVAEVFDGYEWRYDAESAIEAIYNFLNEDYFEEETETERIKREFEEKQAQQKKELEEKQARQIEELKKMMAKMVTDQNKQKEPEPKKKETVSKEKTKKKESKSNKPKTKKTIEETSVSSIVTRDGNHIIFGSYYKKDDVTLEPLKWDILEEKDGNALIITHDIIDAIAFDSNESSNYENSSIRAWLNNDFYNIAFSEEAKKKIKSTLVDNITGQNTDKYICNNTMDNIFLLSKMELGTYFKSSMSKKAKGTAFAKKHKLAVYLDGGKSDWWLRSYSGKDRAYYVNGIGNLYNNKLVKSKTCGVRPVCWISLEGVLDQTKNDSKTIIENSTIIDLSSKKSTIEKTVADIDEVKTLKFGTYYKKNYDEKEPLKWDILERKDGKALIITHNVIDSVAFDINKSNNYEKSSIRKWLNNDFYNTAFNAEEKEKIKLTVVDNSLSSTGDSTNSYICNDSKDNIFLLSVKEAKYYYKTNASRGAKGTEFSIKRHLNVNRHNGNVEWMLRSPHNSRSDRVYMVGDGIAGTTNGIIRRNDRVCSIRGGVRPACWIILNEDSNYNSIEEETNIKDNTNDDYSYDNSEIINDKIDIGNSKTITFGSYYNTNDNKLEPLNWNILEEKDGKALIMTQTIINAIPFLPSDKAEYKKIKMGLFKSKEDYFNVMQGVPDGTYTNNYEYSYIRKWLNDNFINTAFNEEEKNAIQISIVDNSISSTGRNKNAYICDNTKDKLFLLSILEANKYFKSDLERQKNGTLYAIKEGLTVNNEHKGCWWLRSPYDDGRESNWACYVGDDGKFKIHNINRDFIGVCPACWIKLK